jgi:hypothetical protein
MALGESVSTGGEVNWRRRLKLSWMINVGGDGKWQLRIPVMMMLDGRDGTVPSVRSTPRMWMWMWMWM